jgi:hypothetical protein
MMIGEKSPRIKPRWEEADGDTPCIVCWRSDGCRHTDAKLACIWIPKHHLAETKVSPDGTRYGLYDRRTFRHVPPIDAAVDLLRRYFFSRIDLVAFDPPWDDPACPAVGDEALPHLLLAHLGGPKVRVPWQTARKEGITRQSGNWRIGSYGPAPDGTTRWIVCDFDGGDDHAEPLAEPTAVALTAYRLFWRAGIPAYLERPRSGSGWHLWVFFREPIAAVKARALARLLLPHDDALTIHGELADLEIFPKRDNLDGARVGHQVWLPWFCEASREGNVFYRPCDGRLIPFAPEMFETVTESMVDAVLAKGGGN